MFQHIYKLSDNKWHSYTNKIGWSDCGADMDTLKEDRIIGSGHVECKKDPPKEDCCKICFKFLGI
jgi:hypothetical protein